MPAIGLMGLEDLHHLLLDRIIPLHLPKFQSVDRFVVAYAVIHAAKGRTALREKKSLQLHHADHHRSRATRPGSTLEGSLCKMFGLQPAIEVSIPPRNRHKPLRLGRDLMIMLTSSMALKTHRMPSCVFPLLTRIWSLE